MKKPLQQYLDEQYEGSPSAMARDWHIDEYLIRLMLVATSPVCVHRDRDGHLKIKKELKLSQY